MFGFFKKQTQEDKEIYQFLKNILGYTPGNISIYKLALLHKSVSKTSPITGGGKVNNERLEYLGDAVLSTVVANFLFRKYPYQGEGFLTEMRSKIVSRSSLNKLSQKIGLPSLVKYNKDSHSQFKSIDGDALEALIGAIYLERGYDFTDKIITQRILKVYMDVDAMETADWNFKSKLIDWAQKEHKKISFNIVNVTLVGSRKQYTAQVLIGNEPYEQGIDFSIKAAEQLAAEKTYKAIILKEKKESAPENTIA